MAVRRQEPALLARVSNALSCGVGELKLSSLLSLSRKFVRPARQLHFDERILKTLLRCRAWTVLPPIYSARTQGTLVEGLF